MKPDDDEAVPDQVRAFADHARCFCQFVASQTGNSDQSALRELAQLIGAVYVHGLGLPDVEDTSTRDVAPVEALGWAMPTPVDVYWEMFDPYELTEPVAGSLSDDVRDIYADLMRGLWLYDQPDVRWQAAVWEWRFNMAIHWGSHAVDALRALQSAMNR